jgi:hypothetical protein
MRMKNAAPARKEKILTDLPVMDIRIKGCRSSNDFQSDGKSLFIDIRRKLVEVEKVFATKDHHTSIGTGGIEIGETDGLTDNDPSFGDDLF